MKAVVIDGRALGLQDAMAAAAGAAADAVLVHGVACEGGVLHWLRATHAQGWVRPHDEAPAMDAQAFERAWTQVRARGFVAVDAALLGLAGPACRLPTLSWGEAPPAIAADLDAHAHAPRGIYAIVDSAARVRLVVEAGITMVQLRIKPPHDADAAWRAGLLAQLREAVAIARDAGALLVINDQWQEAAELGASAVHLGQEDLLALGEAGRAALRGTGLDLGISSHAVWELCRARALAPGYVACGPVWPTTTKDMPWRPQGLGNLGWWVRNAGRPVVAIGGILQPDQVEQAARSGAVGICVLRGLGERPREVVPALQEAFARGRAAFDPAAAPSLPHPSLEAQA